MTAATAGTIATVTPPVVRALLDEALRKGYPNGVLGVRARPEWKGASTFTHVDIDVTVVPCVSALAVREALLGHQHGTWLVVVTDRDEADLGAGVLAHLVWHRLRTPDPWDAVRTRFAATGVDPTLATGHGHRDVAIGLLAATPPSGWPPAPGGVLTRDHAMTSVARAHLDFDLVGGVLAWSVEADATARTADLRSLVGDALTDAVLSWAADRAGTAARPVLDLLRAGRARDIVPVGLVLGVVTAVRDEAGARATTARECLVRLEAHTGGELSRSVSAAWAREAEQVTRSLLLGPPAQKAVAQRTLSRADELLGGVRGTALADVSDILRLGLARRLDALADVLRLVRVPPAATEPDDPLVPASVLADVEQRWRAVGAHDLADSDSRVGPFAAAVRLTRWLASSAHIDPMTLVALAQRHADIDAWVDSAVNDATAGVADADLGDALGAVLAAVRSRRDAHDRLFAVALANHTRDDARPTTADRVVHLEDVLPTVVLPLAKETPVLLLVLDGMSAAVATELVTDVLDRPGAGWVEALFTRHGGRVAGLAVLPTLTSMSRTSLLCGQLRSGQQTVENGGYKRLVAAHGLRGAELFHKKLLDTSRPGHSVAHAVAAAIDDTDGLPLVTCVLNTIDDALDRSDPGGIEWESEAVKHLDPLLERAMQAGRTVILMSDHGHIVERREGTQRSHPDMSSGRSRPADPPAGDGEVLVEGRRVLEHGGRAVLAVDERLRYGPLKAGYHGGAAPAEVVVPVIALVAGGVEDDNPSLRPAPPQQPPWWESPSELPAAAAAAPRPVGRRTPSGAPTLFDDHDDERGAGPSRDDTRADDTDRRRFVDAVLSSETYENQLAIAVRVRASSDQVRSLLLALLAAPDHRLPATAAATALSVPRTALRGAIPQVQRLLNVESYPVLRVDSDGSTTVLDVALLREQFGVAP